MRYIDKTKYAIQGHAITEGYLQTMYTRYSQMDEGFHPEKVDLYKQFGKEIDDTHCGKIFRNRMLDEVLRPEQEDCCCYCLRKLDGCLKPNIEHVVPNHLRSDDEWKRYIQRTPFVREMCCKSEEWLNNPKPCPPYPHSVAYENLLASCDGDVLNSGNRSVSCNLKRRHNEVLPLALMENIAECLLYQSDGTAFWYDKNDGLGEASIKLLRLNDSLLCLIRRIWFVVNDNALTLNAETDKDSFINAIYGLMSLTGLSESQKRTVFSFKTDKMWNLLLQFDAFQFVQHT